MSAPAMTSLLMRLFASGIPAITSLSMLLRVLFSASEKILEREGAVEPGNIFELL